MLERLSGNADLSKPDRRLVVHSVSELGVWIPEVYAGLKSTEEHFISQPETRPQVLVDFSGQSEKISREVTQKNSNKNRQWESFLDEQKPNQRFINLYGGNFAQQMELNRVKIERFIKVAALEGIVVLDSLSPNRRRSIEANPDGSVAAKRRLFWGEKPTDESENPYYRVVPIPEGWRIEIGDQSIMEKMMDTKSKLSVDKRFSAEFNKFLRDALLRVVLNEKMSSTQFMRSLIGPLSSTPVALLNGFELFDLAVISGVSFFVWTFGNCVVGQRYSLNQLYEYAMPYFEVDRISRSFLFNKIKGRNLVRLAKDDQGSK